jgi:large subunit ribosomal protein L1
MADQDIENAVSRALEEARPRNFTETVDLAVNLRDLDLNDPSNRVDESIVLPAGTGQETTIVVFAEGETALRAEDVADKVLSGDDLADLGDDDDEAKDLADETDFFLAEEALMQDIGWRSGLLTATASGDRSNTPSSRRC